MSPTADRASLLDRLVAVSEYEPLRIRMADAPITAIEEMIRAHEAAREDIRRYGRLGAEWREPAFEIVGDEAE